MRTNDPQRGNVFRYRDHRVDASIDGLATPVGVRPDHEHPTDSFDRPLYVGPADGNCLQYWPSVNIPTVSENDASSSEDNAQSFSLFGDIAADVIEGSPNVTPINGASDDGEGSPDRDRRLHGSFANAFPAFLGATEDGARYLPVRHRARRTDFRYRPLPEFIAQPRLGLTPLSPKFIQQPFSVIPNQTLFPQTSSDGDVDPDAELFITPVAGRRVPRGAPGLIVPGTEERLQSSMFFEAWDRTLIASDGDPELSTRVVDIRDGGYDPNTAGIHSAWTVELLPEDTGVNPALLSGQSAEDADFLLQFGGQGAVAWRLDGVPRFNFTEDGDTDFHFTGFGLISDVDAQGLHFNVDTDRPRILGVMNNVLGGPLTLGKTTLGGGDKHIIGRNARGEPIQPVHLSTNTLFTSSRNFRSDARQTDDPNDGRHDAPLDFKLTFDYPKPNAGGGGIGEVFLAYDPDSQHFLPLSGYDGLWRLFVHMPVEADGGGGGEGTEQQQEVFAEQATAVRATLTQEVAVQETALLSAFAATAVDREPFNTIGSPYDWHTPALSFRAQAYTGSDAFDDMRYVHQLPTIATQRERWLSRPVVLRTEAFAVEDGAGSFLETEVPGQRRWSAAATAVGGVVDMPGGTGLEHHATDFVPPGATLAAACRVLMNSDSITTTLGFGLPDLTTGGLKSGAVELGLNSTDTRLEFVAGGLELPADTDGTNLPTSDPGVAGRLWNNGGVLNVSS